MFDRPRPSAGLKTRRRGPKTGQDAHHRPSPRVSRPFAFRLEKVRSLRERAEDQAREELAQGLAHHRAGVAQLQAADHAAGAAHEATRDTLRTGATAADLLAAHTFAERTQTQRRTAVVDLQARDAEVAARRAALVAAAREREVLERLQRRARSRHDAEHARIEQGNIDEIALAVHRRAQVAAA
jgi:flagellar FliJ protein